MAGIRELYGEIKLKDAASGALKGVNNAFNRAKSGLGGMLEGASKFQEAFDQHWPSITAGTLELVESFKTFGEAALKDNEATEGLKTSLTAVNAYSSEHLEVLEKSAEAIERVSTVNKETIKGLMSSAMALGIPYSKVNVATKDAIGLARMFKSQGLSQAEAMTMLGRAYNGSWMQLERYIPALKRMQTNQQKNYYLQSLMAKGWTAEGEALKGPEGAQARFNNAMEEFQVTIGKVVLSMAPLLNILTGILNWFSDLPGPAKEVIAGIILLTIVTTGLLPIMTAFIGLKSALTAATAAEAATETAAIAPTIGFGAALWAAMGPILLIVAGIALVVAGVFLLIKNWKVVSKFFQSLWADIVGIFRKAWDFIMKLLDNPVIRTLGLIFLPFITIPLLIIKHWKMVSRFFMGLPSLFSKVLGGIVKFFTTTIPNAVKSLIAKLMAFVKQWGGIFLMFLGPVGWIIDAFKELEKHFKIFEKAGSFLSGLFGGKKNSITAGGGSPIPATKVQDAIITKGGRVIETHPDDNIIAAKGNPLSMMGGGRVQLSFGNIYIGNSTSDETKRNIKKIIADAVNEIFGSHVATVAGV